MSRVAGELTRAKTHEADDSWPTSLEIVAYFGENKKIRRSVVINPNEFFGQGGFGAPMSGERLIKIINDLRRQK